MARDKDIELVDADEEFEEDLEEELEDEEHDDDGTGTASPGAVVGFLTGLVVGVVAGAGVALLLAPDRGDVTRRRIRSRFQDMQDDAEDRFKSVREETGRRIRRGRRRRRRSRRSKH